MRSIFIGTVCFLLGAATLVFAQSGGLRPDQFITYPWTWGGAQNFNGGFEIAGVSVGSQASASVLGPMKCGTSLSCNSGVADFNPASAFGTPASSSAACTQGQSEFDGNYAYFCVATNTWLRLPNGATW